MKNPLADLIPAAYRKYVYGILALAGLVLSIAQILGYDVSKPGEILAAIVGTLGLGLAHGNTKRSVGPRE